MLPFRAPGSAPASPSPAPALPVDDSGYLDLTAAAPAPQVKETRADRVRATQVAPFLFLGAMEDASDAAFLQQHHITTVINLCDARYWTGPGVRVFPFPVTDTAEAAIEELFQPTSEIISRVRDAHFAIVGRRMLGAGDGADDGDGVDSSDSAAEPTPDPSAAPPAVLVHCQKGVSRSATVVAAYFIRKNGWSVTEAIEYLRGQRPMVMPNIGFCEKLLEFERSVKECRGRRRRRLCLIFRLATPLSEEHARSVLEPYGTVWKVEQQAVSDQRDRDPLVIVYLTTAEGQRFARRALVASGELRQTLVGSDAPLSWVRS